MFGSVPAARDFLGAMVKDIYFSSLLELALFTIMLLPRSYYITAFKDFLFSSAFSPDALDSSDFSDGVSSEIDFSLFISIAGGLLM